MKYLIPVRMASLLATPLTAKSRGETTAKEAQEAERVACVRKVGDLFKTGKITEEEKKKRIKSYNKK